VGIGAVGAEMVRLLKKRNFPVKSLMILARNERTETIDGVPYPVKVASPDAFQGMDFAFFAGTEGAKGASQMLGWEAVKRGCVVIDNGDDFRMDPRVPLVIPEINADALKQHQGFVSNPNCSTIIALVALAPLHRAARVTRVVVATYQATSGWGLKGPQQLRAQTPKALESQKDLAFDPTVFARPIAFNCIPHIDRFIEQDYTREEWKMVHETHKILGDDRIRISATAVRVPVLNGHSEAVWIETEKKLTGAEAREILRAAPGVVVMDEPAGDGVRTYPTQYDLLSDAYKDMTLVGRIREDTSSDRGLAMYVVADNIRKGAALNVVQIAEKLIERGLVKA